MNEFNITLNIEDLICGKCCKDKESKTLTITSTSQVVNLKENYILNIVDVSSTKFTVLIQNGIETIIRNIYTSYDMQICLPCRCATHILTVSGTIIEA